MINISRNVTLFLIFTISLALGACAEKQNAVEDEPLRIKAVSSTQKEIPDEASGFGSLSYLAKIDITSPQEGVIKEIFFREGDTVETGGVIVLLENPQIDVAVEKAATNAGEARAALELARSRLQEGIFGAEAQLLAIEKTGVEIDQAKKNWEENKRKHANQEILFEAGGLQEEAIRVSRFALAAEAERILIMEKELEIRTVGCRDSDLARAGFAVSVDTKEKRNALISLLTTGLRAERDVAAARLEAVQKELASLRIAQSELAITIPSSGVVGMRYFEKGERVKPGEKLFTLLDTASLYALFPIREKDALRIQKGMDALIEIDGAGESRNGQVDLVYPQADSQSLSFLIRVLLDDMTDLKPGMFVRGKVTLGPAQKIIAAPESAIVDKHNDEGTVFVINGTVLSRRRVVLGPSLGGDRIISAGLNSGEMLVAHPDAQTKEGIYVSVSE